MNEEEFIAKLKETAGRMQADGIDPTQIQGFIDQKKNEWRTKYGGKTDATAEETATVVAGQPGVLDLQSESGLLEQPIEPEVPTWLEDAFGQDTFGVDFASDMYRAVKSGWRQSDAAGDIADVFTGDYSDKALDTMREKRKYVAQTAQSEEMQAYNKAVEKYKKEGDGGFLAGFKAFIENPSIGPEVMVSSLTQLVGTALEGGEVSATVAAGAGLGAAVGASGSMGIATIPGMIAGAQGASMMAMEALGTFGELLEEKVTASGGKFSNNDDIRKVLEDEDQMSDLYRKAIGRGVAIGTIEAFTGGLAGKVGAKAIGRIGLGKVPALAGAASVEAAGGSLGETAGMIAAGQELKGEEIFLEGIAGMAMAPVSVGAEVISGNPQYVVNGKKVKAREGKATIKDMVRNSTDEEFAGMKVNISKDPKLTEEVQERRKKIIKNNKTVVKNKIQPEAATDIKRSLEFEIKKAKAELKKVKESDGDVVAKAVQKKIDALEQELQNVDNHINFQLDELNEEETLALMNIDDDVSLYQSVLNDPNSTEAAKKAAEEQLLFLKNTQLTVLNNTDSTDLANPDGPRKEKNIELSRKTQEAFESGDVDGIIKAQQGTISSIATSLWSRIPKEKQVGTYEEFKTAIVTAKGGLLDMLESYKPETKVPLAAYLGDKRKGLRVRANRIVKELTKQDIEVSTESTEVLNSYSNNEIDVDTISIYGPKYNSQKLGLGVNLLEETSKDVELATQKIENELAKADKATKPLTQKQRQSKAEKAFDSVFKNKYVKRVKDKIGKKLDKEKYIRDNVTTLKKIALANRDFQKGNQGLAKDWNKYPPSDQEFIDYYMGTDTSNTQAISDRKKSLAEAVSKQIGKDAKDNYFEGKEAERAKIGENFGIAYLEDLPPDFIDDVKAIYTVAASPLVFENPIENQANYMKYTQNEIVPFVEELHNNTDPVDVNKTEGLKKAVEGLTNIAKKGFLSLTHMANMANTGRKEVTGTKASGLETGVKYYEMNSKVEGSILVKGKHYLKRPTDQKLRESDKYLNKYKGKFKPSNGNVFYGKSDPNFEAVEKVARENYKGEAIKKQGALNFFTKTKNVIVNKVVSLDVFKELVEKHRPKAKMNQELVKQMAIDYGNAVKNGANPYIAGLMLKSGYASTSGAIKTSYEFKGFENDNLEFGESLKFTEGYLKNSERRVREEHSPPVGTFAGKLLKLAVLAPEESIGPTIDQMYTDAGQYLVSFKHDEMIDNGGLASSIMPGSSIGYGSSILRLLNAGIPPTKITSLDPNVEKILRLESLKSIGLPEVVAEGALSNLSQESKNQTAAQMQEDLNPDPKLSKDEAVEALSDMLGTIYGMDVITTKKALEEAGYSEADINKALRSFGFEDSRNGYVFINSEKAGLDTAMHEFTHVWANLVFAKDPELFNAIYDKLKSHPRYAEAISRMSKGGYVNIPVDSFGYKNEVMAYILGEEGKSLYEVFAGDAEAKSLIDKFFDYVREALGFDPTVKNFADLNVDQVVKLAVKDMMEGNPSANFNKLQNVAEGKSWYAKSEAAQSPSAKAKADPLVRAFNKLKLSYRENKDLAQAINDAYAEVEGLMDFIDFARLVAQNTKEVKTGKTNQLLVAKAEIIKANKIAEESAKKQAENKVSKEQSSKLQDMFRRIIYQAKGEGAKASRWFIPPNAEDFKGLLYAFLPKGKLGVDARKWMEEYLLKPYSNGIATLDTEILHKSKAWADMSKGFNFEEKVGGTPYTLGDAIKVYNALQEGVDPGIAKKKHLDALIHAVESNSEVLNLANEVAESFPIKLESGWQTRAFAKEIYDSINNGARKRHLETFSNNVDAIFTDATLDLIADQYGEKYRQAIVSTLRRMKSGRNRVSTDANANSYMNWLNRAVGTTMFLNTRSAILQLLSTLNFIGKPGNNIFQATAAFANQKQWKADYNKLWNSDYLANRRDGAKFDVLADEIAEGPQGLNKILKFGFLPTRYADSFAIALGGAAYYRNRINMLMKEGMSETDAEAQAMIDWRATAEESQQSSDPSKISEIQASSIGKIIYAFANTPFQYARITKRKLQDITSGRSAAAGTTRKDMQSILYYSVAQAAMFNALQSGLVALLNSNDPDDEELKEEKYALMLERTLTSFAKSTGNPGAVASTLYAMMKEGYMQQTGKKRPDANAFAVSATSISPPLNSKLRDLAGAYRAFNKIEEGDAFTPSLDNEALTMAGEVASFGGIPLDRVVRKARHLAAIKNEEAELWQKIWMLAGWSSWELGVKESKDTGFKAIDFKDVDFKEVEFKESAFKKLEDGIAGRANRDGTIEIDPNLSPVEREKTKAHENQHQKDMNKIMENGERLLDYDDNYVYWRGEKFERKNGKIKYKGKWLIEGHPTLAWEKRAYDAEPSTKEIKREKLYA